MSIKINNREIGDGHLCLVNFEAGPTHDGLESLVRNSICPRNARKSPE